MNAELRDLLVQAGYPRAAEPGAWSSVVVVKNFGAVPPPPDLPPESSQKGFKLLLLDRKGRATHLAHVGASDDPLLEREASILTALGAHPAMRGTISPTRSVCSGRIRVLLTRFIAGRPYAALMRRQRPEAWGRTVTEILEVAEAVTRCAVEALPALFGTHDRVSLAEAAEPRLVTLGEAGFPSPYLDVLRSAFWSVAPLPRRVQHGDLWPANVLRHRGSWWLIDFAECGQAQVPLYDAFLLVHHTWMMRGLDPSAGSWGKASREVVAAAARRAGLAEDQVGAALAYYLVHLSAYRLRHGVWHKVRAHFLRDLLRLAEALESGTSLAQLPYPWERPGATGFAPPGSPAR